MSSRNYTFIFLIILSLSVESLTAQSSMPIQRRSSLTTARFLLQQGAVEEARKLFEDVLRTDPRNAQAYRGLEDIYKRLGEYESLVELIRNRLSYFPNDMQAQLQLGEAYYLLDEQEKAAMVWKNYEDTYATNVHAWRLLVHTYSRIGLSEELISAVERAREQFNDSAFLATDLANWYQAHRAYDNAVNEYMKQLLKTPQREKYITDRILIMSDEAENPQPIETTLQNFSLQHPSLIRPILAAFYFKTGRYEAALAEHKTLGMQTPDDQQRWLKFANNLRLEKQYDLAIRSYEHILKQARGKLSQKTIGEALLGLGKTFEDQIVPDDEEKPLVSFFPDNLFFTDQFYTSPNLSTESLERAFHVYDSVLVRMPKGTFSALAQFRLGEIQYRITRDFDGALDAYNAALEAQPSEILQTEILIRIGDVTLARGNIDRALTYYSLNMDRHPAFEYRSIQTQLYTGNIDTVLVRLDSVITRTKPTDAPFNDLMELRDLIQQYYVQTKDSGKVAFQKFLEAERLLKQYKLSEAAELLSYIRNRNPNIDLIPLLTLREALVRLKLQQPQRALNLAEELTTSPLADIGWTLKGEILESYLDHPRDALDNYHQVLEQYPASLYLEPVRYHVRDLTAKLNNS